VVVNVNSVSKNASVIVFNGVMNKIICNYNNTVILCHDNYIIYDTQTKVMQVDPPAIAVVLQYCTKKTLHMFLETRFYYYLLLFFGHPAGDNE